MELEKSVKSLSLDVLNCEARFSKKCIVHTICGWREIPVFLNLALYWHVLVYKWLTLTKTFGIGPAGSCNTAAL